MAEPQSVRVPPANLLGQLLACPAELLDVTLDQLRTLLVVHETGSALRAARALGRDQSSVQKQLDTLNRNFRSLCGEFLVTKQGRGQDFLFTATGQATAQLAQRTFDEWQDGIAEFRRRLGGTVTVGTTRFTLDYVGRAWKRVAKDFTRYGAELKLVHVRTRDLLAKLETRQVDLACGSVASAVGDNHELAGYELAGYEVIEWRRGGLAVLTNLPPAQVPGSRLGTRRLRSLPLVVPATGVIADFLHRWYGPDYRNELNIVAEIDEIHYGLALLTSRLVDGCMIVTKGLGRAATEDRPADDPEALRLFELDSDHTPELELVAGVFARKGERRQYESSHPLNLLWTAFEQEAAATGTSRPTGSQTSAHISLHS